MLDMYIGQSCAGTCCVCENKACAARRSVECCRKLYIAGTLLSMLTIEQGLSHRAALV